MVNCRKVKFSLQFNMLRDHACPQLNYCNSRGFCAILVALTISAIFLLTRFAKLQSFSFLTNFILIFNFFLVTIFMKKILWFNCHQYSHLFHQNPLNENQFFPISMESIFNFQGCRKFLPDSPTLLLFLSSVLKLFRCTSIYCSLSQSVSPF